MKFLKNIFASAALSLAGTAFALAATETFTSETDHGENGSYYVGFSVNLTAAMVETSADSNADVELGDFPNVSLNSITLFGRTKRGVYNEFKIAVFSAAANGRADGKPPSVIGDFLGMSTDSAKLADDISGTWHFDNLAIGTADRYLVFVFVPADTAIENFTAGEWKTVETSLATSSRNENIGRESSGGLYKTLSLDASMRWTNVYLPHFSIKTTAVSE